MNRRKPELLARAMAAARVGPECDHLLRAGFVLINGSGRLADFWVRYSDGYDLVILGDSMIEDNADTTRGDLDGKATVNRLERLHKTRRDSSQRLTITQEPSSHHEI
ncbi:hypothetical protein LMG24238_07652 [Paraburkholderia sediminicola]|uniref:Uncharacterized protein n=1 Tax=Paraburkholderia sediminicola TaxID=458836 RepID=A0A6J5CUE2_9BURK|nr:hypothetical protein [Paraburkholderia sediminicola]CAB3745522.1 hypothetical protein LMG24238_07652 [Paraburkholderia sediminicola]